MADILLAHSNHLYLDRKQVRKMQPYPPLGTLIAAACLRSAGFEVALFDTTFEASAEAFDEAMEFHRPRLFFLCEDNFNFLTKMCLVRQRELGQRLAGAAKRAGAAVMVNGSDATDRPFDYLDAGADFVLAGEPEATAVELAERLLRSSEPAVSQIAGLVYRDAGQTRRTAPRAPAVYLDRLPPPAWDLVDTEPYRRAWNAAHGHFSLNAVASRGCPYRCNWCSKPIYGQAYHTNSPRRVAEEMLRLKRAFAPDRLWFSDDIFALSPRWTAEFAQEVADLDALIPFRMQSRCDLMTRPTVEALRQAGCEEVWMGAESGSQKVLDAMDKGIRVSDIFGARENLRAHGIRGCYFIQFGYPGEGWDEILETVRMVRATQPDDIGVSVSYPLPGTRFHELVSIQLGARRNWLESDDLAMMFQGAYTTRFYRLLRDTLHLEVEMMNGRAATGADRLLREHWSRLERLRHSWSSPRPSALCA
jgi:radical SAM superfamily enzyme YgiQ (UPF0313 family)